MASPQTLVWRDDDIGFETDIDTLMLVDDFFQLHRVTHTIAVMVDKLHKRPDLVEFIRARGMDVQLHCWDHIDLSKEPREQLHDHLSVAVEEVNALFGKRPTVLYPPWNRSSDLVREVAAAVGMVVHDQKISLEAYIRTGGGVKEHTINFHYWATQERDLIPQALEIYRRRRNEGY